MVGEISSRLKNLTETSGQQSIQIEALAGERRRGRSLVGNTPEKWRLEPFLEAAQIVGGALEIGIDAICHPPKEALAAGFDGLCGEQSMVEASQAHTHDHHHLRV